MCPAGQRPPLRTAQLEEAETTPTPLPTLLQPQRLNFLNYGEHPRSPQSIPRQRSFSTDKLADSRSGNSCFDSDSETVEDEVFSRRLAFQVQANARALPQKNTFIHFDEPASPLAAPQRMMTRHHSVDARCGAAGPVEDEDTGSLCSSSPPMDSRSTSRRTTGASECGLRCLSEIVLTAALPQKNTFIHFDEPPSPLMSPVRGAPGSLPRHRSADARCGGRSPGGGDAEDLGSPRSSRASYRSGDARDASTDTAVIGMDRAATAAANAAPQKAAAGGLTGRSLPKLTLPIRRVSVPRPRDDDDDKVDKADKVDIDLPSPASSLGDWSDDSDLASDAGDDSPGGGPVIVLKHEGLQRTACATGQWAVATGMVSLSEMLALRAKGLRSVGCVGHAEGQCVPCLMQARWWEGKCAEACRVGTLCGRCHEQHTEGELQQIQTKIRRMRRRRGPKA